MKKLVLLVGLMFVLGIFGMAMASASGYKSYSKSYGHKYKGHSYSYGSKYYSGYERFNYGYKKSYGYKYSSYGKKYNYGYKGHSSKRVWLGNNPHVHH